MIYLSQLTPNLNSHKAQRDLGDLYELHRTLQTQGFGTDRETSQMLYRIENTHAGTRVLVQSAQAPDWTALQANQYLQLPPQTKTVVATLAAGTSLRFRLIANPTKKKMRTDAEGKQQHSNRVPLVHEAAQQEWLQRKAMQNGFALRSCQLSQSQVAYGKRRKGKHAIKIYSVQFDGVLTITDADKFQQAWQQGIGPAKAFGCGLLSIGRA